ncbi:transposase [Cecembia calidifontis]|uniref:transposase n=1 Tax=Cecembia calidifontis TaxID=1187080 RepID=UPI001F5F10F8|nr:transposase [Cecembia calidifontis]
MLTNKNCYLYRINGVEDHLHILNAVHPIIAPSSLIKDIKLASSDFIKRENIFPNFKG